MTGLRTSNFRLRTWGLGLVLAAFVLLATTYSVVTPIFEAPDEIQHYFFVKHLADGHGLPVQGGPGSERWAQEGNQPPLYYALGALATFWIDTGDADELLWLNPQANVGLALEPGNKNRIIHTTREAFPWRGTALAVHLVRFLSVLMGAATVVLTYLIAAEVFPGRRALAVGAAAVNAFIPQFLFISGSVNNDNLVVALSSLALLMMVKRVADCESQPAICNLQFSLRLGLVVGLAALAKLSGLGLLPLALLAVAVAVWQTSEVSGDFGSLGRRARLIIAHWSLVIVATAIVACWWYARNVALYGDPTGLNVFLSVVGRRVPPPTLRQLAGEFEGLRLSLWGLFGWFNILMDRPVYTVLDALAGLAVAGWLVRVVWRPGREVRWWPLALLITWLAIVFASLVRWTWLTLATQGRLLFPAISAIAVLLVGGLGQWLPRRYDRALVVALGGGLFALAVVCPFRYIAPAYARPPLLAELPADVQRTQADFNDEMRLLGYRVSPPVLRPGERLEVTLCWQALAPMKRDYNVFVHLLGRGREVVGQANTYPGRGTFPTTLWQPGDTICDTYGVPITPTATVPTLAWVDVGLYDRYGPTQEGLPATDAQGRPVETVVGRVKLVPWSPPEYDIAHPVRYDLGGQVVLIGYDLDPPRLTLYWQAEADMTEDYTVFVHLIGEDGQMWGQHDGQPLDGDYPTSAWDVGEVVRDEHEVAVKAGAPPGVYRLAVGMYRLADGQRLPVLDAGGQPVGTHMVLDEGWVVE